MPHNHGMTRSAASCTVLVIRVWLEAAGSSLRGRLTWVDEEQLPKSTPVAGSPRSIAAAVERLIDEARLRHS